VLDNGTTSLHPPDAGALEQAEHAGANDNFRETQPPMIAGCRS
jgi:hypothetical protein